MLLGGGCALLLEVAHPKVAAGVADHSAFESDPFGRLQRTLAALSQIVFGTREGASRAASRVERAHAKVHGRVGESVGRFLPGDRYDAGDAELRCWVWATLVWTSLRVYELFEPPLPAPSREAFYRDQRVVAGYFGVPGDIMPGNWPDFEGYFECMVATELAVGPRARAIAAWVIDPPVALPGRGPVRRVTTALLPSSLRAPFGLEQRPGDSVRLAQWIESVKQLRGGVPGS